MHTGPCHGHGCIQWGTLHMPRVHPGQLMGNTAYVAGASRTADGAHCICRGCIQGSRWGTLHMPRVHPGQLMGHTAYAAGALTRMDNDRRVRSGGLLQAARYSRPPAISAVGCRDSSCGTVTPGTRSGRWRMGAGVPTFTTTACAHAHTQRGRGTRSGRGGAGTGAGVPTLSTTASAHTHRGRGTRPGRWIRGAGDPTLTTEP